MLAGHMTPDQTQGNDVDRYLHRVLRWNRHRYAQYAPFPFIKKNGTKPRFSLAFLSILGVLLSDQLWDTLGTGLGGGVLPGPQVVIFIKELQKMTPLGGLAWGSPQRWGMGNTPGGGRRKIQKKMAILSFSCKKNAFFPPPTVPPVLQNVGFGPVVVLCAARPHYGSGRPDPTRIRENSTHKMRTNRAQNLSGSGPLELMDPIVPYIPLFESVRRRLRRG